MQTSKMYEKSSVGELVTENYVFAAVLHYFGISFYQYPGDSLEKVCQKHKVNPRQLIAQVESWAKQQEPSLEELYLNPIELLVAYLKKKALLLRSTRIAISIQPYFRNWSRAGI